MGIPGAGGVVVISYVPQNTCQQCVPCHKPIVVAGSGTTEAFAGLYTLLGVDCELGRNFINMLYFVHFSPVYTLIP